jgi:antitoxin component HigA of HigAB toxin-antitoxin module
MKWTKPITTEQEYEKALKRLSEIFDANPDKPRRHGSRTLGHPYRKV